MRKIIRIIIHCTATPLGRDIGSKEIRRFHISGNGWQDIGYHYIIRLDGTVERGRPEEIPGAHCRGLNADSIGIAYVGGLDARGNPADTRTPAQIAALRHLLCQLQKRFPDATIHGHNEFAAKACPCFNVLSEFGRHIVLPAIFLLISGCRSHSEAVVESRQISDSVTVDSSAVISRRDISVISLEADRAMLFRPADSLHVQLEGVRLSSERRSNEVSATKIITTAVREDVADISSVNNISYPAAASPRCILFLAGTFFGLIAAKIWRKVFN